MARYEYMRMHISLIPDEIIEEYKLLEKVDNKGFCLHGNPTQHVRTKTGRKIIE